MKMEKKKSFIGCYVDVFISKYTKSGNVLGRTMEYIPVLFLSKTIKLTIGSIIHAKIIDATPGYFIGE